jgi:ATP/maltotriose-dependent transcriptional regulator MalT
LPDVRKDNIALEHSGDFQVDHSVRAPQMTPPHLPQVLNRPRLLEFLKKNKEKKIIFILGQAAQGKTTLAASYVKTSRIPTAWLNLDQSHSDPVNLFYLIVQSLQYVLKENDLSPLLSGSRGIMSAPSVISLFRDVADFISKNVSYSIQIVFDGLDRLLQEPLPFQCLQAFIEGLPPNVHLVMLSRGTPPLSLEFQHLNIRQEAIILTNEDSLLHWMKSRIFQKVKR